MRPIISTTVKLAAIPILVLALSCSTTALLNLSVPASDFARGAVAPVPRTISVGFVNNTPFRAIFTYGAYDPLDKDTLPSNAVQVRLEGNTSSAQQAQPCQSTFSVGGDELVRLLNEHENDPNVTITDPRAVVRGIYFSGAPLGDPLEAEPTEGTAVGRVVLNGIDFSCLRTDIRDTTGTGLLIFTFEQDASAPGGFRIDYSFIQP